MPDADSGVTNAPSSRSGLKMTSLRRASCGILLCAVLSSCFVLVERSLLASSCFLVVRKTEGSREQPVSRSATQAMEIRGATSQSDVTSVPDGTDSSESETSLVDAVQDLRPEIETNLQTALKVIPKGLDCLEWAKITYYKDFECRSIAELKYTSAEYREEETDAVNSGTYRPVRVTKLHVDAEGLGEFRPTNYSLVISTNVFEHLSTPETSFKSMVSSMAPGAWLWMTTPFFEISHGEPYDFHRFTYFSLYVYARNAKMCIHDIGGVGYLSPNIYTLSFLIAQKPPCLESEMLRNHSHFQRLDRENGYVL